VKKLFFVILLCVLISPKSSVSAAQPPKPILWSIKTVLFMNGVTEFPIAEKVGYMTCISAFYSRAGGLEGTNLIWDVTEEFSRNYAEILRVSGDTKCVYGTDRVRLYNIWSTQYDISVESKLPVRFRQNRAIKYCTGARLVTVEGDLYGQWDLKVKRNVIFRVVNDRNEPRIVGIGSAFGTTVSKGSFFCFENLEKAKSRFPNFRLITR